MRLVLVDSYDSFTWNLVQAFEVLGADVTVLRSDRTDPDEILARGDAVVLGPGPGRPEDAGCLVAAVRALAGRVPILGVCLGHQAIGLAFGGAVVRERPVHGHATPVIHDGTGLFEDLPQRAPMTRYHSLVVEPSTLPSCLRATAWSADGVLMGLTHRELPIHGVQFHPESVLSGEAGQALLSRFVRSSRPRAATPGTAPGSRSPRTTAARAGSSGTPRAARGAP